MKGKYYLSELFELRNIKIERGLLQIINAPCGSGKSYFMKKLITEVKKWLKNPKNIIYPIYYLCDLRINRDDIENQIEKLAKEYKDNGNYDMYYYLTENINVMCYATFGQLNLKHLSNCLIIMDEFQQLFNYCWKYDKVTNKENGKFVGFKKHGAYWNTIKNINNMLDNDCYMIGLSGTDEEIWRLPIISYYQSISSKRLQITPQIFSHKDRELLRAYVEDNIYYYNNDYNVYKVLDKFIDTKNGDKALGYTKTIHSMEKKKQLLNSLGYKCEFLCSLNAYTLELFEPTETQLQMLECGIISYEDLFRQYFKDYIEKLKNKRAPYNDTELEILAIEGANFEKAYGIWFKAWEEKGMKVAKKRMSKAQKKLRDYILKYHRIPNDIDILLLNDAYITGFNLYDKLEKGEVSPIKAVITNSNDIYTNRQARNRNRNDLQYWFIKAPMYSEKNGSYYLSEIFYESNGLYFEPKERLVLDNGGNEIMVHDFTEIPITIDDKFLCKKLTKEDKAEIQYLYGRVAMGESKISFSGTMAQLYNYELYSPKDKNLGTYIIPNNDKEILIKAIPFVIKNKGKRLTDKKKAEIQNILGSTQISKCNQKLKDIGLGNYKLSSKVDSKSKRYWIIE